MIVNLEKSLAFLETKAKENNDEYNKLYHCKLEDVEFDANIFRAFFNAKVISLLPDGTKNKKRFLYIADFNKLGMWKEHVIKELLKDGMGVEDVKIFISKIVNLESYTCVLNEMYSSVDLSFRDVIDLMEREEWIEQMFMDEPDLSGMTPVEITELKNSEYDRLSDYIHSNNIEPWVTLINSGGVPKVGIQNMFIFIGTRPDLSGNGIHDTIIPASFARGMKDVDTYLAETQTGISALISTKVDISEVGSLGKNFVILNIPNRMYFDNDYECDSITFRAVDIVDQIDLDRYAGRYRIDVKTTENIVIHKSDTHLIGTTIALRSPMTCNCKDGICRYCVGDDYYYDNLSRHVGVMISKYISEIQLQLKLGAKHNQDAKPKETKITITNSKGEDKSSDIVTVDSDGVSINIPYSDIRVIYDDNSKAEVDIIRSIDMESEDIDVETVEVYTFRDFIISTVSEDLYVNVTADLRIPYEKDSVSSYNLDNGETEETMVIDDIDNIEPMFENTNVSALYEGFKSLLGNPPKDPLVLLDKLSTLLMITSAKVPNIDTPKNYDKARKSINPITAEIFVRNLIRSSKDNSMKIDWSKPVDWATEVTTVNMNKAIKVGDNIEEKLALGFLKETLINVDHYDKDKMRYSELGVLTTE